MNIIHCGMKYANSRNGKKEIEMVRAELAPPLLLSLSLIPFISLRSSLDAHLMVSSIFTNDF